jgi:hypothetical protein
MTSASKNQYRQPRFRIQLLQFDAVYIWSKFVFWGKQNSCTQKFIGHNQRNQTSSHTLFLTGDFLREFPLVLNDSVFLWLRWFGTWFTYGSYCMDVIMDMAKLLWLFEIDITHPCHISILWARARIRVHALRKQTNSYFDWICSPCWNSWSHACFHQEHLCSSSNSIDTPILVRYVGAHRIGRSIHLSPLLVFDVFQIFWQLQYHG